MSTRTRSLLLPIAVTAVGLQFSAMLSASCAPSEGPPAGGENPGPGGPSDPGNPGSPPVEGTPPVPPPSSGSYPGPVPPADLKIALTGDTDTKPAGKKVLEMLKAEGVHALLTAGDLQYSGDKAAKWEGQINPVLGADFPLFPARGNHDETWTKPNQYRERLTARWNRLQDAGELTWSGDPGMKSVVHFKGVTIVAVAPSNGVSHADSAAHIRDSFANDKALWRISMWHENMPAFRGNAGCGSDGDLVGWEVFEESRKAGAFILNGHNHCYSRSKMLSCTGGACSTAKSECKTGGELPTVANVPDPAGEISLKDGEDGTNYVILAGMGGHELGRISRTGPWWAKQGGNSCEAGGGPCELANAGAVICTFNPGGLDPRRANCRYLDIDGKVLDSWSMTSDLHR